MRTASATALYSRWLVYDNMDLVPRIAAACSPQQQEAHYTQAESLQRNLQPTPLSTTFFSADNVDALQHGIRYSVYKRSGGRYNIDKQDARQLHYVMRSVYLQHARNDPVDVLGQVRCLNGRVLEYCVSTVLTEIEARQHYLQDISTLPVPLEQSVNVSSAGTKVLRDFLLSS